MREGKGEGNWGPAVLKQIWTDRVHVPQQIKVHILLHTSRIDEMSLKDIVLDLPLSISSLKKANTVFYMKYRRKSITHHLACLLKVHSSHTMVHAYMLYVYCSSLNIIFNLVYV